MTLDPSGATVRLTGAAGGNFVSVRYEAPGAGAVDGFVPGASLTNPVYAP